ncbi:hypothetical protein J6590_045204 [Homalodisca vitripennis]|nr:hypothetical protein J6590_045204 [Homalodisca vitripennis]
MLGRSTSNVVMSWAPQRVGPVDVVSGGGTCAWPIPFLFYLPWTEVRTQTGFSYNFFRSQSHVYMKGLCLVGGHDGARPNIFTRARQS